MKNLVPENLKYTASHEWAREEGDDIITLGITHHAQELLGDVVFVELPELNRYFALGEGCAVVESVKAAADVYAPVAGEIIEVNSALLKQPELMNNDPYHEGWLCKLHIKNKAELAGLMSSTDYEKSISEGG